MMIWASALLATLLLFGWLVSRKILALYVRRNAHQHGVDPAVVEPQASPWDETITLRPGFICGVGCSAGKGTKGDRRDAERSARIHIGTVAHRQVEANPELWLTPEIKSVFGTTTSIEAVTSTVQRLAPQCCEVAEVFVQSSSHVWVRVECSREVLLQAVQREAKRAQLFLAARPVKITTPPTPLRSRNRKAFALPPDPV